MHVLYGMRYHSAAYERMDMYAAKMYYLPKTNTCTTRDNCILECTIVHDDVYIGCTWDNITYILL